LKSAHASLEIFDFKVLHLGIAEELKDAKYKHQESFFNIREGYLQKACNLITARIHAYQIGKQIFVRK
jgi:hypothetical protein